MALAAGDNFITLPGVDWKVEFNRGSFKLVDDQQNADGTTRIMGFEHRDGRIDVTVSLKPAVPERTLNDYRTARAEKLDGVAPTRIDEKASDGEGRALLEFRVENPNARTSTKHVYAFMLEGDTLIEVHVVKRGFLASQQRNLDALLDSIRVEPKARGKA